MIKLNRKYLKEITEKEKIYVLSDLEQLQKLVRQILSKFNNNVDEIKKNHIGNLKEIIF